MREPFFKSVGIDRSVLAASGHRTPFREQIPSEPCPVAGELIRLRGLARGCLAGQLILCLKACVTKVGEKRRIALQGLVEPDGLFGFGLWLRIGALLLSLIRFRFAGSGAENKGDLDKRRDRSRR